MLYSLCHMQDRTIPNGACTLLGSTDTWNVSALQCYAARMPCTQQAHRASYMPHAQWSPLHAPKQLHAMAVQLPTAAGRCCKAVPIYPGKAKPASQHCANVRFVAGLSAPITKLASLLALPQHSR